MTKLEKIIRAKGLRKFRLAQSLDMSESTLSVWAQNGLPQSVEKAVGLAELLEVPLRDLLEDTTDESKSSSGKRGVLSD